MILLIDNYDSFSYNLYQLVGTINPAIQVVRNDEITVKEIEEMQPSHIIISPGPGRPEHAGICEELIDSIKGKIPVLGVCLGHQAVCGAFGTKITYAKKLMHGKMSVVNLDTSSKLLEGLKQQTEVARYHSLAAQKDTLPDALQIIAETEDGEIMGVQHKQYPVYGVQFHPESILTPDGRKIIENFLSISIKMEGMK